MPTFRQKNDKKSWIVGHGQRAPADELEDLVRLSTSKFLRGIVFFFLKWI
jgi:hypothetical protein